ncbi:MAG: hypothetical protein ACP5PZ_10095 [Bacteroidales bacterium]
MKTVRQVISCMVHIKQTTVVHAIVTVAYCVLYFSSLSAQVYRPLEQESNIEVEQNLFGSPYAYSTFLKPYDNEWYERTFQKADSTAPGHDRSWLIRKMFYESYIWIDSTDYRLIANPLFNFSYGNMSGSALSYYHNIRGATVGGNILRKLYFESSVFECQSRWPLYISDYIHSSNVVPGMGQARRFGTGGFDYALAQGSIAFPINKRLKLYLGNGKFFAGDGYRSLLLSDVAFNYPSLFLRYNYGYLYFSKIFAITMSDTLPLSAYGLREKRLNSFGIISLVPYQGFELSFFEGYVYRYPNRIRNIRFNPLFFNPLPAINLLKNDSGFGSVVGINIRINIFRNLLLYQQIALSNPHYWQLEAKNSAYQVGVKWYNAFFLPNLYLQAEWNKAGAMAYTASDSLLYYSHYNQPLAHLLGNNFNEKIILVSYRYRRLTLSSHASWVQYGQQGQEPLPRKSRFVQVLNYPTPFLGNGPYTDTQFAAISLGYWINPTARQKIEIGFISRLGTLETLKLRSQIFYVAFKVNWNNTYVDF